MEVSETVIASLPNPVIPPPYVVANCDAVPVIVVTAVAVTTRGSCYTSGYIRNADIIAATNAGGAGSGAELDVIIPPKGGHGANAREELGGFFVMMNTSLEGTESANSGDVSAVNDFRKIVLLRCASDFKRSIRMEMDFYLKAR